jgi:hypothetical protein
MNNVVKFLILFSFIIYSSVSNAQELQCVVTIDASQAPDVQSSIIDDLKQSITRFLNERRWTEDTYSAEERIRCNLVLTITSLPEPFTYKTTAQIQSSRPVYGTGYETVLLNFIDKTFDFTLNQGQPIDYNENIFNSNISSLLSFYAYIILALDYDSFGKLSGQKWVEKAYNIANIAQQAGGGWSPNDLNNRFALIENLNSQLLIPFREGLYSYHRMGLDNYLKDPEAMRMIALNYLKTIKTIVPNKPSSILIRSFFLAKRDELINIFRDSASSEIKDQALALLRELDPLNSDRYQAIVK